MPASRPICTSRSIPTRSSRRWPRSPSRRGSSEAGSRRSAIMDPLLVFSVVYGGAAVVFLLLIVLSRRVRRHGGAFRAGVVGAMYEWQNKDTQNALDAIVEGNPAETRPDDPDGDRPQLESRTADRPGTFRPSRR